MDRREFISSSVCAMTGVAASRAFAAAGSHRIVAGNRRILYVLGQFSQATPESMRSVVETIGSSAFNVLILSFLQASVSGGKLTLLYNGNEFFSLRPEVPGLLARLRSGFGQRKKIMLSIGGWQHQPTFEAIRSFGIPAFVRQMSDQVIEPLGLEGIDLDLEPQTGGLDKWMAVHDAYGKTLVDLTNEYKRVHPHHLVTHAPLSSVAAALYVKPAHISGLREGLLAATRSKNGNNVDWLNVQFYEGGLVPGGDIARYYRESLALPLTRMRAETGIGRALDFLTPLFQPEAKQSLAFCTETIQGIDRRCADLKAGRVDAVALWDYRQVASSIQEWSRGLEAVLHG